MGLLDLVPEPGMAARFEAHNQFHRGRHQVSAPVIHQVTDVDSYYNDMLAAMRNNRAGAQVTIKTPQELSQLKMFRTEGGGGFSVAPDGDVVAVFGAPTEPRSGWAMLQAANEAGGLKLDAFDTFLPGIYEKGGYRPVARVRWNDEFAPKSLENGGSAAKDWDPADFAKYQNGKPDVVLFVRDPAYQAGSIDRMKLPTFDDWDSAAAIQSRALQELHGGAPTGRPPAAGLLGVEEAPRGGLLD